MSFLAPATPAMPAVPTMPPPAPMFGAQPVGQKPTAKPQQATFLGAGLFPTQQSASMSGSSAGKTLLGT